MGPIPAIVFSIGYGCSLSALTGILGQARERLCTRLCNPYDEFFTGQPATATRSSSRIGKSNLTRSCGFILAGDVRSTWGKMMTENALKCSSCGSGNVQEIEGEVNVNFPRSSNLDRLDTYFVVGRIALCADCGFARFKFSASDLQRLRAGIEGGKGTV